MGSDFTHENETEVTKTLVSRKSGIPVYQGVLSDDSIPDLIDRVREERIREIAGLATGEELLATEKSGHASEEQIPQG